MPRPTLLLADDHAIVADGLRSLLSDEFDLVGVVHDGRALLEKAEQLKPALIVTDISMPGLNGLDAIRQLRKLGVSSKVIVLTMHIEPDLASRAFRAGVSGYLLKQSAGEELIGAIREVLKGRVYLTPLIAGDVITILMKARDESDDGDHLTSRQREVLQLIAEGRTMKEIGGILNISTRTAESHKYDTMQTLGVGTTAELVQWAVRLKLVDV